MRSSARPAASLNIFHLFKSNQLLSLSCHACDQRCQRDVLYAPSCKNKSTGTLPSASHDRGDSGKKSRPASYYKVLNIVSEKAALLTRYISNTVYMVPAASLCLRPV